MRTLLFTLAFAIATPAAAYDPLATSAASPPVEFTVRDEARNRDIPLLVYLPAGQAPAPVVLFSHGLGGSREGSPFFGRHWAARGYAAVFLQHAGSDTDVWKSKGILQRKAAMSAAASPENFLLRVQDVPAVLDQLTKWAAPGSHALAGRLDTQRIGMSGHSFGAVTTLAVSGQTTPQGGQRFTDPRIKAALAMSPNVPKRGSAGEAFGAVKGPWLLMTGTQDHSLISGTEAATRLQVFAALPPGDKYQLVLHDAEHSAFTGRPLPGDKKARNPNHHRAMLAISTAFWDAHLKQDPQARAWLDGDGPRTVLESQDVWQRK